MSRTTWWCSGCGVEVDRKVGHPARDCGIELARRRTVALERIAEAIERGGPLWAGEVPEEPTLELELVDIWRSDWLCIGGCKVVGPRPDWGGVLVEMDADGRQHCIPADKGVLFAPTMDLLLEPTWAAERNFSRRRKGGPG